MIAVIVIIGVLVLLGIVFAVLYNRLVGRRNQVDNAWSQIDVQLKRRYDLIPNLVEAVKDYMQYEQETLTKVTEARAAAINAGAAGPEAQAQAENMPPAPSSLFAVAETTLTSRRTRSDESAEELVRDREQIAFARISTTTLLTDNNATQCSTPTSSPHVNFTDRILRALPGREPRCPSRLLNVRRARLRLARHLVQSSLTRERRVLKVVGLRDPDRVATPSSRLTVTNGVSSGSSAFGIAAIPWSLVAFYPATNGARCQRGSAHSRTTEDAPLNVVDEMTIAVVSQASTSTNHDPRRILRTVRDPRTPLSP